MFLVYNFVVASVFLIYLQYEINTARKKQAKQDHKDRDARQQEAVANANANGRVNSQQQQGDVVLVRRKISTISGDSGLTSRPSFSSISQAGIPQDQSGGGGGGGLAAGDSASRTVRQSLGSIPEDEEAQSQAGGFSNADFGSEADEGDDVFDYINVHSQTATLAHEGTSFYLRLGCLCKLTTNFFDSVMIRPLCFAIL